MNETLFEVNIIYIEAKKKDTINHKENKGLFGSKSETKISVAPSPRRMYDRERLHVPTLEVNLSCYLTSSKFMLPFIHLHI